MMARPKHLATAILIAIALQFLVPAVANAEPSRPVRAYTGGCHAAVDAYWPARHRAWAHRIVHRESRGIPTAANPRSSARGCFQMLLRYSARFYRAVGCSNAQWMVARCNVRAAYAMFRVAGRSPWRLY
jgi:hypothetical protein